MANVVNDNAQSDLSAASEIYKQQIDNFNQTLQLASQLLGKLKAAEEQLGVAKFKEQQAASQLYVAQSMKEQADKATAIITMQETALNSSAEARFEGCDQQAYPSVVGSGLVRDRGQREFVLESGKRVLSG